MSLGIEAYEGDWQLDPVLHSPWLSNDTSLSLDSPLSEHSNFPIKFYTFHRSERWIQEPNFYRRPPYSPYSVFIDKASFPTEQWFERNAVE